MKKLIGSFVVLGFMFSPPALAGFSDVRSGSQLEGYINVLVEKGIISGYPDGSFKPERTINRAEALKIIFETIDFSPTDPTNPTDLTNPFPDVPKNEWYAQYVTTAKKKDIVRGYPDGTFRPTQEVNRAEFIKMVMSALPFFNATPQEKSVAIQQYSDVYDLWYTPYVSAGLQLGFLNKTGELKPTAPMQRQDAVEIVYRISKYLEENPSALSTSEIPYVPEESFTVIDPVAESSYSNPELGPDVIIVKKDIGKTEVFQKAHGYDLNIPQLIDAWSFENAPHATVLQSADECRTLLVFNGNSSIQQTYEQITNPNSFMTPYKNAKLVKLDQYKNINAYRVEIFWDDESWITHLVELAKGTLEIVTEGYKYDSCVKKYPDLIMGGMNLR